MPLIRTLVLTLFISSLCCQAVMGWSTTRTNTYHEENNTHLWILHNALNVMKLSEGDEISSTEMKLLSDWNKPLEQGMHHADWLCVCNTFYLYGNHYYNPDTGKSFIPTKTAKDMGVQFFEEAGKHYTEEDLKKAFFYLGLSLHYVTDLTQPMHAALFTDWNIKMPLYHNQFEEYAAKIQDQFALTKKISFNRLKTKDPGTIIHQAAQQAKKEQAALVSKEVRKSYLRSFFNKRYQQQWQESVTPVIRKQLIQAQILTAQFIHLWFQTYVIASEPTAKAEGL